MTRKIAPLAALALLVFSCSRSGKMQRDQKQYDVVPEGSASGVTSTISGPGETKPPVTETNVDTTTAFTIPTNPNPLSNDTAGTAVVTNTAGASPPPMPKKKLSAPPPETHTSVTTSTTETTTSTPPPTDTTGTQG